MGSDIGGLSQIQIPETTFHKVVQVIWYIAAGFFKPIRYG